MTSLREMFEDPEPRRVKSYTDLKNKCPELHKRICYYCARKKYGIDDFFIQFGEDQEGSTKELATMISLRMAYEELEVPEPKGPPSDEVSIDAGLLAELPRLLFNRLRQSFADKLFSTLIEERQEIDAHTALPNDAQMNQIIRQRTPLNNQLSKAIGELRHVIAERKKEESSVVG